MSGVSIRRGRQRLTKPDVGILRYARGHLDQVIQISCKSLERRAWLWSWVSSWARSSAGLSAGTGRRCNRKVEDVLARLIAALAALTAIRGFQRNPSPRCGRRLTLHRPIVLCIIPLPPGGTNDIMARAVSDKVERRARPADRDREPQYGRQRHCRHAPGRACGARRLYDHPRLHLDPRHQDQACSKDGRYDPRKDFAPIGSDRVGAGTAACLQGFAGTKRRRVDRPG